MWPLEAMDSVASQATDINMASGSTQVTDPIWFLAAAQSMDISTDYGQMNGLQW